MSAADTTITCYIGANTAGSKNIVLGGSSFGTSTITQTYTHQLVPLNAQKLVAGDGFYCAIVTGQRGKCWGKNIYATLGQGDTTNRLDPSVVPFVDIGTGRKALDIAAGIKHVCVLRDTLDVVCWGTNIKKQLGSANTGDIIGDEPADMGDNLIAVNGLGTVSQIFGGGETNCALHTDGTVKCWGDGTYGQLGSGTFTQSEVPLALSGGPSGFTKLFMGGSHACGIGTDALSYCWGHNVSGQLGLGNTTNMSTPTYVSGLTSVLWISPSVTPIGSPSTCFVLTSGQVKCTGDNTNYQLGNATTTPSTTPILASELSGVSSFTKIVSTAMHVCGIFAGVTKCWGNNTYMQLGVSTPSFSEMPLAVNGLTTFENIQMVTAGISTCIVNVGEQVKCWGSAQYGQLGNGTGTGTSPVAQLVNLGSH